MQRTSIGRRAFTTILFFGLILTLLMTGARFFLEYRSVTRRAMEEIENIRLVQSRTIALAVWNVDMVQVKVLIEIIVQLPYVHYVAVTAPGLPVVDAGTRSASFQSLKSPLSYTTGGTAVPVGELEIQLNQELILQDVTQSVLWSLGFQALFLLAQLLFLLLVFKIQVTRHLVHIADYVLQFDSLGKNEPLVLNKVNRGDELDILSDSFMQLNQNLKKAQGDLNLSLQELKTNKERLELATQGAGIGIWDWDIGMNVMIWDDSMYSLYGMKREDFAGDYQAWKACLFPEDEPMIEGEIQAALRGEREYSPEFRIVLPDGSLRFIASASKTYRNHEGNPVRMIGINSDITEKKKIEQELIAYKNDLEILVKERTEELRVVINELQSTNTVLEKTNKNLLEAQHQLVQTEKLAALGSLVAGVAHELNTPIGNALTASTTISGLTESIPHSLDAPVSRRSLEESLDDIHKGQQIIEHNLKRAADLISNFKQLAVDQTSHQQRDFFLHEVVRDVIMALGPTIKRTPHRVLSQVPEHVLLKSYPGPLGQVFINLINNALVHGFEKGEPGTVSIHARVLDGNDVEIRVQDDGRGISPEHHDRIFEPFFTTRLGQGGSGLGLHIVYTLCTEVLGGTVELDSAPNRGACFVLTLPLDRSGSFESAGRVQESSEKWG